MNLAILRKSLEDYRLLAAGVLLLLGGFVVIFIYATNAMPLDQGRMWFEIKWIRNLLSSLLGSDLLETMTPTGLTAFVFSHPLTWSMLIAFIFASTTGLITGEIDRGTMDLLATLPVSRASLYASATCAVLLYGIPLCGITWVGVWIGNRLVNGEVELGILAVVTIHLYITYVFLACLSIAVAACCSRRTSALTVCFVIVFYAFVLNMLVAFWPALKTISFTGFMHYYRPLVIVKDNAWQWPDMAALVGGAVLFWSAGLVVFRKRDFPAR